MLNPQQLLAKAHRCLIIFGLTFAFTTFKGVSFSRKLKFFPQVLFGGLSQHGDHSFNSFLALFVAYGFWPLCLLSVDDCHLAFLHSFLVSCCWLSSIVFQEDLLVILMLLQLK